MQPHFSVKARAQSLPNQSAPMYEQTDSNLTDDHKKWLAWSMKPAKPKPNLVLVTALTLAFAATAVNLLGASWLA